MRTFKVIRKRDETGVSGTGVVIEGVVFSDGQVVIKWLPATPGPSMGIFPSFGSFVAVHVAPHGKNRTEIVFGDGEVYKAGRMQTPAKLMSLRRKIVGIFKKNPKESQWFSTLAEKTGADLEDVVAVCKDLLQEGKVSTSIG